MLEHELPVDVVELHVKSGRNLHVAQLAPPEHVANTTPARLEKVRHRPGRARTIEAAIADQPRRQPVGADGGLAWAHTRARPTSDVLQVAHRGVLEPGRDILRPHEFALAEQRLQRRLLTVGLGDAEHRWTVAQLVEGFIPIVEGHLGRRARGAHAKVAGGNVDDPFRHQPIGRNLAADDRGEAFDSVALVVVDDGEVAAHLAAFRFGAQVVEGPHAGVGAHGARRRDAVEHHGALFDHAPHLIPLDGERFRVRHLRRGGPENRYAQPGHDDVAVARLVAAIDRRVRQPPGEHHHRSLDRHHLDLHPEEARHQPGPGAGRVDHRLAGDRSFVVRLRIADADTGQAIPVAKETDDFGVGHHPGAPAARRFHVSHHQVEGVEVAVLRNPEDRTHMFRKSRLAPARLIERNPLAGDAGAAAALDEPRLPLVVFLSHRNEIAAGVLDRAARNPAQDAPFLDALDGGLLVVDAVPAARVQQPVRASRGARGEVAFLDQDGIDAAQRQVAKHPGARRPTPDDDNARAGVRHSRERGKDQRGPFPSS